MTATILVIAREFTEGGAAYLALRHLRRMAVGRQIDLLVTGPVSPTLAAELPANVTLARLEASLRERVWPAIRWSCAIGWSRSRPASATAAV